MKKQLGFTLVEIMIVVAIIAILAAIAIPQLVASRKMSFANRCLSNAKVIEYAKEQAALNLGTASGGSVATSTLVSFIKEVVFPTCPRSGAYSNTAVVGTATSCSIHGTVTSPTAVDTLTD